MSDQYVYAQVPRRDVDKLLRGEFDEHIGSLFSPADLRPKFLNKDEIVAVWPESFRSRVNRPVLLVIPEEQLRENFAWISTYQPEFSPLSQWCRVIDAELTRDVQEFKIPADLGGLEAAWAGAVIGEIIARRGVDLSDISLIWCLSSGTFAFARLASLWPDKCSIDDFIKLVGEARGLLKAEPRRELDGLSTVWRILRTLDDPSSKLATGLTSPQKSILSACQEIRETGRFSYRTAKYLSDFSDRATDISEIDDINAEDRVRLIDTLFSDVDEAHSQGDRHAIDVLSFLVGYSVGRVGAGEGNLQLLLPFNAKLPIAAVWAPTIAGLYDPIPWSSAMDGLGRLIVRELLYPLDLLGSPTSDISMEELRAKISPKVNFKKLPFRPASSRVAVVELFPGVNLAVNLISEWHGEPAKRTSNSNSQGSHDDTQKLAKEIQTVLNRYLRQSEEPKTVKSTKRRTSKTKEPKLPFKK